MLRLTAEQFHVFLLSRLQLAQFFLHAGQFDLVLFSHLLHFLCWLWTLPRIRGKHLVTLLLSCLDHCRQLLQLALILLPHQLHAALSSNIVETIQILKARNSVHRRSRNASKDNEHKPVVYMDETWINTPNVSMCWQSDVTEVYVNKSWTIPYYCACWWGDGIDSKRLSHL
ncbi:hypothetical protein PR048_016975 [Dryococelus australis]|uniref:Transposase n=1 Tax=Dryococelus australis TaxID=614101 RepID=A0ABQ9H894_9NEOP|nr:hypothetical protein PR048_016975 [Dryococelus australis]